jgi:hypothetical protein
MRLISWLLLALSLSAGTPVFNGTFDNNASWTVLRGIGFADPSVQREGHRAFLVQAMQSSDAYVESPPIHLTLGKRYEVGAYVRSEGLEVQDTGRSPVAVGAAISMASMPWDVHSESIGGTRDWTRISLRFIASRPEDRIVLKAADGGLLRGKAWFEGVSIDEVSSDDAWPARSTLKTYGPAYRYPVGGWIYLHIEGEAYERGYQHGTLMAKEIPEYLERCAADYDPRYKDWNDARKTANALFLRGFDQEILQEMKGIADGASDAGAKWQGRRIDLIDIVTANVEVEMTELREALPVTPTGLEALHLKSPQYANRTRDVPERCSAFAATGKATRDGKMVIAHETWWPLTLAEQTNVMLDLKPAKGHRVLMQSYPGGIESGTDWYQNDAGVVLTETTLRQSPFNSDGTPVAYRARKSIQYGDNIDKVVEYLSTRNNGLYTNEWLIGDAKNDEIAMFELGTYRTKLWRSSRDDWFGGTEGFYWGCNNAKDLNVRLEYKPDPKSAPEHIPYVPTDRDLKWQELYQEYKGAIDEQFAFKALRTAPLVGSAAMDGKVATSTMAANMMVWAVFGKPNEREWVPSEHQRQSFRNHGLYSSGYRLITTLPPAALGGSFETVQKAHSDSPAAKSYSNRLWQGWILPASNEDAWLSAGSAAYYSDLESGDLDNAMAREWAEYRRAKAQSSTNQQVSHEYDSHRGAILLDTLRRGMGDDRFFEFMRKWFGAHSTQAVSAQQFLDEAGTTAVMPLDKGGPQYVASDINQRLANALIVYGTTTEAGANRYAAEQLQKHYLDRFEAAVPIFKDFELSEADLANHDVIFVGRPESNSAVRLEVDYKGGSFQIGGHTCGSESCGLILAASNPLNPRYMLLLIAGNRALETVRLSAAQLPRAEFAILEAGRQIGSGFLERRAVEVAKKAGFSER